MQRHIKCVILGDEAVGKTCLCKSYGKNQYPGRYISPANCWHSVGMGMTSLYDNYILVDDESVQLSVWDTTGLDDYERLRPLCYPQTDVFLVCYSVISPVSYENVRHKWYPEIHRYAPDAPFLLVGTKTDLSKDPAIVSQLQKKSLQPISMEKGNALAQKIGAVKYLECSAHTGEGVKTVFDEVIKAAKIPPKTSRKCCKIL